jgi:hypothetical protein
VRLKPGAAARETAVAPSRFAVINSVMSRSSRRSCRLHRRFALGLAAQGRIQPGAMDRGHPACPAMTDETHQRLPELLQIPVHAHGLVTGSGAG